uniref:Sperm-tail PG-rich repeat containing 4 n=1 Tax=Varanus komodoensis TaxID=61221 RepID=A0A8D2L718_VARKO
MYIKQFGCYVCFHQPTPIPGSYPVRDFLEDAQLNPVKATYNFRNEGRKRKSIFQQMPDLTLPDTFSYNPPSFVELAGKRPATYSFKNTSRDCPSHLSYRDKNINLDPGQYDLFPPPVPTFPTNNTSILLIVIPFLSFPAQKVPGPGSYWPTRQAPKQPRTIASLGREHTIFFSNVPEL